MSKLVGWLLGWRCLRLDDPDQVSGRVVEERKCDSARYDSARHDRLATVLLDLAEAHLDVVDLDIEGRVVGHVLVALTNGTTDTESDLGELRAVGLSDRDILDMTLIVSYFNFVNRIALGLGPWPRADP